MATDTTPQISRRTLLRYGAAAGVLLTPVAGLVAGCGSSSGDSASDATTAAGGASTTSLDVQLNWITDPEFSGSYLASDRGFYREAGFDPVQLISGGPTVSAEASVAAGKAPYGYATSETLAAAVAKGADLKVVGVQFQKNPYCIMSLGDDPITSVDDLAGKTIGIQAINETLWSALLSMNGLTDADVQKVAVQNDPSPLTSGEVDGFLSFVNNQPPTLQVAGEDPTVLLLSDMGFVLYQQLFVTTGETLANDRQMIVDAMTAEARGANLMVAEPAAAVDATMERGDDSLGLDPELLALQVEGAVDLMVTPWTEAHGLLSFDPGEVQANIDTLAALGLELDPSAYVPEVMEEVYADGLPS